MRHFLEKGCKFYKYCSTFTYILKLTLLFINVVLIDSPTYLRVITTLPAISLSRGGNRSGNVMITW